jgi:hypothetical protein
MLSHYHLTPLEQWIEALYQQHDIVSPEQLQITEISAKLNIWVYFMDMGSMAVEKNGLFSVNIDRRLSAKEQWEDFLHELCHILRHSGDQMAMPAPLLNWQEKDAANFQLYAALPFSMIKGLKLPERQGEIIELLAEEFRVTHRLAADRLEQIQRRMLQGILDEEYRIQHDTQPRSANPANWSKETQTILDKLQQLKHKGDA